MDETLYAIPINDAFGVAENCPLCRLKSAYEEDLLRYYLGPALMEPSVRKQTNVKGFCQTHFHRLHRSGINRLGCALILQTHLEEKQKNLTAQLHKLCHSSAPKTFFKTAKSSKSAIISELINNNSCLFCEALRERMEQYYHTLVHLYQNDENFKKKFLNVKTLCVPHAAELAGVACTKLSSAQLLQFSNALNQIIEKQFMRVQAALQWYVEKHDYRNQDAPWGESREASINAITLLLGEESQ